MATLGPIMREHGNDLARARRLARELMPSIMAMVRHADSAYLESLIMCKRSDGVALQCGWERGEVSRSLENVKRAATNLVVALIELRQAIERRTK